jgi:hypothetical protein
VCCGNALILLYYSFQNVRVGNVRVPIRTLREPGSSVSIVSDCRLDEKATEVRSPAETKNFHPSLCAHITPEVHPSSCPMGTGSPFPGRDANHSTHLVPTSRISRSYTPFPSYRLHGGNVTPLHYFTSLNLVIYYKC